jgi:osmotically-inducible protein OsmY
MVKYSVKNAEVTLTGTVNSQALRSQAQTLAAGVPNVRHVVNELQVKDQKATGTN